MYASDFWGGLKPPSDNPIEKVHHMVCKHILNVQKQTTNIGVLLELGRIPLQTYAIKAAIKNWERIKSRKINPLLLNSYEEAAAENLPWLTNIKMILERNGMACFYINNYEGKIPFIHKKIFQKLSDSFHQEAFAAIRNPQSKLRTYGIIKQHIGCEKYLLQITNPSIRQSLTKFRLSNHVLNIEKGRHTNTPEHLRTCPFCPNTIESEIHFLVNCPTYRKPRDAMIAMMTLDRPSFAHYTPNEKLQYLLSEENTQFVSTFVHNLFEIRKFLIERPKRTT